MADETTERHCSYGRGGAGNMRRPSVMEQAKAALENMPPETNTQRRRSSVWSLSNDGSRRGSIWKSATAFFRRDSTSEEVIEKETGDPILCE